MKKYKLAIILYGNPDQYPVNLQQYADLKKSLNDFEVFYYDFNRKEQEKFLNDWGNSKFDIVLKNSYGRGNENYIERVLEKNKIPFIGSDSKSTLIGTSKHDSKELFKKQNIPVLPDVYLTKGSWKNNFDKLMQDINALGFPLIVKASAGTDSRGLVLVSNEEKLIAAIDSVLQNYKDLIVEKYLEDPYEVTCLVIDVDDPKALEPIGIINKGFVPADTKDQGKLHIELPAKLSFEMISKVQKIAIQTHRALECRSFSRTDILIQDNLPYVLETDVHPGFRLASPTTKCLERAGINLNDLFLDLTKKILRKD